MLNTNRSKADDVFNSIDNLTLKTHRLSFAKGFRGIYTKIWIQLLLIK